MVFNKQAEFAELLKIKLCPMIYRRLATADAGETSSPGEDFALTCRLWRVTGILMRADFTKAILTSEADAFLAMAARVLEEARSNWERALAIEFTRELFSDTATMRSLLLHDLAVNRRGDSSITQVIVTLVQATANVSISMITKLSGSPSLPWAAAQLRVPLLQQFEKSRPPPISDVQLLLLSLECTGVLCRLIGGDISAFLSLLQGTWAAMQKPILLALATCQSMDGEWRAYILELASMLIRLLPGLPGPNGSALDVTLASLAEMATPQYQQASSSSPSGGTSKSPGLGSGSPSSPPSLGSLLVSEQNLAISLCLLQLALDIGEQLGPSWLRIIHVIHANDQFNILKAKRAGGRAGTGTTMTLSTGDHLERFGEIADLERRIMEQSAQLSLGTFRDFLAALCALLTECIAVETSMSVTTGSGTAADGGLTSLKMAMVLFPAQKIKQVALLNVDRWAQAEPVELSAVWEMLVHQLVRLTDTADVPLRGLACETVNLLLTQLAGAMDMTTLSEQPTLQARLFTILERILGDEDGGEGEGREGSTEEITVNEQERDNRTDHVEVLSYDPDVNDEISRSHSSRPRHRWLDVHRMVLEVLHRLLQQTGPHLTVAWPTVFRLLGIIREQDGATLALVKGAFISCRLVTSEFLGSLNTTCLGLLITLLAGFARTETDLNISLTAIGLLWDVADHIRQREQGEEARGRKGPEEGVSEGGKAVMIIPGHCPPQQLTLFDLWIELLNELSKLASDHRPDIRNSAIQTVIRTIDIGAASPHQGSLGGESFLSRDRWRSLCERVLWPLLQTLPQVALQAGEDGQTGKGNESRSESGNRNGEPDEEDERGEETRHPGRDGGDIEEINKERGGKIDGEGGRREDEKILTSSGSRTLLPGQREKGEGEPFLATDLTRRSVSASIGRPTGYVDLTHHSRDSREKQWDETLRYLLEGLTLLFTRYLSILIQISIFGEREWPALQDLLLEHVRRAHSQELVTVAINCLSQLAMGGEMAPEQMREVVWRTWREMGLAMAVVSTDCRAYTQSSLLTYIKIFPHLPVSEETAGGSAAETGERSTFEACGNPTPHLNGARVSSSIISRLRESLEAIDGALRCPTPGDPVRDTETLTELQQQALHLLESHVLREGRGSTVGVRRSIYLDRLATWLSWLPEYEQEGGESYSSAPSGFTYLSFGLAIISKIQLRMSEWEVLEADHRLLLDSLRTVIRSLGRVATRRYQLVPPSVSLTTGHILWRGATQALNTVLLSLLQKYKPDEEDDPRGKELGRKRMARKIETGPGAEHDKKEERTGEGEKPIRVSKQRHDKIGNNQDKRKEGEEQQQNEKEETLTGRVVSIDSVQMTPPPRMGEGASSPDDCPLACLWETVVMALEGQLVAMRSAPLPAALSLEQVEADEEMDVSQVELIRDKLLPLLRREDLVRRVLRGILRGSRLYTISREVDREGRRKEKGEDGEDEEEDEGFDESARVLPKLDLILASPVPSFTSPGSAHSSSSSDSRPYSPSVTSVMNIRPVLKERVAIACLYSLFAICHDDREGVERMDSSRNDANFHRGSNSKDNNNANFSSPSSSSPSSHPIAAEPSPSLTTATLLVRQIGLPILLGRCQRVLMRYAADRAALGRMPFPRIRQDEIALILRELNRLVLPPRTAENTHNNSLEYSSSSVRGEDLTRRLLGGSRGHLFFLYPQLVQCMRLNDPTVLGLIQQSFNLIGLELGLM